PHCHSDYDEISNENSKAIVNAKEIGNLINKIVNNSIEYNIHEMREYVKNLLKTLPPTIRSYVINLSDKLGSENSDVYRDILKFYGGIFTFDNSSTSVYLFHKLKGLDHAKYSKRICIEDFICLNNLKDNENYKRYYIYFINELKEAITAEYINNIYSILKKFF
ncbi:MAG: Zn-dependent exopeptidase M28, partial [Saccharolobus sp.]